MHVENALPSKHTKRIALTTGIILATYCGSISVSNAQTPQTGKSLSNGEYTRLDNSQEMGLLIQLNMTRLVQTARGDGAVAGKIARFIVGTKDVTLESNTLDHDQAYPFAFIVTRDYGRIGLGGAYDGTCAPPQTPAYAFSGAFCFWLTSSQKDQLKIVCPENHGC